MLQIHTDPQAEDMGGLPGGMAGMSPDSPDGSGMMGPRTGQNEGAETGMPTGTGSGSVSLIPQRPDHIMLRQGDTETIEGPAGSRAVTNSSVRGLLARNLGYYVVASFLMGTQQAVQCEGILASVGNDYLVIYQPDQNRFVSGDIYSLKFVEFHEDQSPCRPGYRRRDAFQGW